MEKQKQRLVSLVLALVMCVAMLPVVTNTVEADGDTSDYPSLIDDLTWTFENGVLTISGTGELSFSTNPPWYEYSEIITSAIIEEGVTSIGYWAFQGCVNLTNISIPNSVISIEGEAFLACKSLCLTIPASVTLIGNYAFFDSSVKEITFEGDAPIIEDNAFELHDTTAYYPAYNSTWTADVLQDYGGTITWVAYDPVTIEIVDPDVDSPYTDVSSSQWFYEPVMWAYENSFMTGRTTDTFAPDDTMTRAEFVTVLYRMENGEDEYTAENDNPFTDVSSTQWFYKYVMWAYDNEIVNGTTATTFDPDGAITREQIATILYRLYGEKTEYDLSSYPDADEISSYAEEAVQWAVSIGLIKGNDDGTLDPQGNATRAQVATIYMRYVEGE